MTDMPKNIPLREAPLVGGPFDGKTEIFDTENFEPDEVRFDLFFKQGIIPPITLVSKDFPEGAIYEWNKEKLYWQYKGVAGPKTEENFKRLLGFFGIEPNEPF